jgi:hypothetical protein
MSCGVLISSVKFLGQTCQVTFLEDGTNQTFLLGEETIPFTFFPADGTPQGSYFMYFSGSDTTYPLIVSGACPTPTPTITPTPTVTPTQGQYNDLFSTGSTSGAACISSNIITLYSNQPFYTPNQLVYTNPGLTILAPLGYYVNNGVVFNLGFFGFVSQGSCPTQTPTPTNTSTQTPTNTNTPTVTPTQTITPTETYTPTPTLTPTETPTQTPTLTPTQTPTLTPTNTITPTETFTPTPTVTNTPTNTSTPTPSTTPAVPVTSNLVLYYDPSNSSSYSGTGTTVNDLSGNGLSGTMSNVSFTDPYFSYNGSSSEISVPDNALLEPGSGDWSIEFWVNYSVLAGSSRILIAKTDGGLSAEWGYGLRTAANGNTFMEIGNGTTSLQSSLTALTTNTWYQVVGVWTNVSSNSLSLYINGNLIGSISHSFTSIKNTTSPLYLGSFNGGQFSQWLNGRMGVVRIYDKSLTSSEILQNYNADKSKYGL